MRKLFKVTGLTLETSLGKGIENTWEKLRPAPGILLLNLRMAYSCDFLPKRPFLRILNM